VDSKRDDEGIGGFGMSDEEKACQIGNAVLGLNDAKVELAHLNEKLRSVMDAYAAVIDAESKDELAAVSEQISLSGKPSASYLMNEKQLAELLHSQESAKRQVEQSTNQLMRLGITTL